MLGDAYEKLGHISQLDLPILPLYGQEEINGSASTQKQSQPCWLYCTDHKVGPRV